MYNYQTFLKEGKLKRKFDNIKREYYETLQKKDKIQPSLIHSHKKRIQGFILAMIQKPTVVTPYSDLKYQPRSLSNQKNISHHSFQISHHSQKSRIQEQSLKNSYCDPVPFNNTFSHKFRDYKDQSTLKPLKYTATNSSLRIKEELQRKVLNYLPNVTNKRIDKLCKNREISWKDQSYIKQLNKSLLPSMHNKTYYNSLKTIYAQAPTGFLKAALPMEKYQKENNPKLDDLYEQDIDFDNAKKQTKNSSDCMNRKQNSKQALIKCGLLKKMHKNLQKDTNTLKRVNLFNVSKTANVRC